MGEYYLAVVESEQEIYAESPEDAIAQLKELGYETVYELYNEKDEECHP